MDSEGGSSKAKEDSSSVGSRGLERGGVDTSSGGGGGKGTRSEEFVNTGLQRWEARRNEWLSKDPNGSSSGGKDGVKRTTVGQKESAAAADNKNTKRARSLDVDAIIESIFSTNGDTRLPQSVPLSKMIDLLVDFWEADGLYD